MTCEKVSDEPKVHTKETEETTKRITRKECLKGMMVCRNLEYGNEQKLTWKREDVLLYSLADIPQWNQGGRHFERSIPQHTWPSRALPFAPSL